jgi:hypothetical protein
VRRNRIASRISVFEVQDQDVLLHPDEDNSDFKNVYFTTSDGSDYRVEFSPNSDDSYWMEFELVEKDIDGYIETRQDMVGDKQAFEVMQQVLNALNTFMKSHPHVYDITFSSNNKNPSRTRVYLKMLDKFGILYNHRSNGISTLIHMSNPYYKGDIDETE